MVVNQFRHNPSGSGSADAVARPPLDAISDELRFRILGLLESDTGLSQRRLAKELGIALGRLNAVLHTLIATGLVTIEPGHDPAGRPRPTYTPTPQGRATRAHLTPTILAAKRAELARLVAEIAVLSGEWAVGGDGPGVSPGEGVSP